jgi:hypothetical protein
MKARSLVETVDSTTRNEFGGLLQAPSLPLLRRTRGKYRMRRGVRKKIEARRAMRAKRRWKSWALMRINAAEFSARLLPAAGFDRPLRATTTICRC